MQSTTANWMFSNKETAKNWPAGHSGILTSGPPSLLLFSDKLMSPHFLPISSRFSSTRNSLWLDLLTPQHYLTFVARISLRPVSPPTTQQYYMTKHPAKLAQYHLTSSITSDIAIYSNTKGRTSTQVRYYYHSTSPNFTFVTFDTRSFNLRAIVNATSNHLRKAISLPNIDNLI